MADSITTACVQLPYLGSVSLLPFLRNNCRAKTSTFPSLHSTCFAVVKQRQALSHLYTALASLLRNKDKHFPICTQHLLHCGKTKTSTFPSVHSTCFAVAKKDKHFPISTQHLLRCCKTKTSTFPSLQGTCRATFQDFPSREMGKYGT